MPRRPAIITLLTDFGTADTYVGQMKGVILAHCPGARIVDLTHEVPAGDVREAAFALASAVGAFPQGTVHVAVVDPQVGTGQARLAVGAGGDWFLAPDNGLLSPTLAALGDARARRLPVEGASATFHGRDIFARAAAHLAAGRSFARLGPEMEEVASLKIPRPRRTGEGLAAEVIHVDRFGNLITNLLPWELPPGEATFKIGRATMRGLHRTYGEGRAGELLALVGSHGHVEIAASGGSAAEFLEARRGTELTVTGG